MTDFLHPPGIVPMSMAWQLQKNQSKATNPYSNTGPRNDRGGDLWTATVDYAPLVGEEAALMHACLHQISKAGNAILMPVFQNDMAGTESATATFANMQAPWREAGVTGWTQTNLLEGPRVVDRTLEIYGGPTPPGFIYRDYTVVPGAYYQVAIDIPEQNGANVRVTIFSGETPLVTTGANTSYGRRTHIVVPTTSMLRVFLYSGNDTDAFSVAYYGDLQVARVMSVQTATAAGASQVVTFGGVNGTLSNFKVGQFVNVQTSAGYELKRVVRTVRQIGVNTINGVNVNHVGRMPIEPALRGSAAQYAAIVHNAPVCRMILSPGPIGSTISAPLREGFRLQFIEEPA